MVVNNYLAIAQAEIQAALNDASPVTTWLSYRPHQTQRALVRRQRPIKTGAARHGDGKAGRFAHDHPTWAVPST
jgi:hypothetical protein